MKLPKEVTKIIAVAGAFSPAPVVEIGNSVVVVRGAADLIEELLAVYEKEGVQALMEYLLDSDVDEVEFL